MNRRTKIAAAKYAAYSLVMLLLYVLQTDPNFFYIDYIKPVFVLPFAVCIAMFESQLVGGLFGLFAGVLCDASSSMLFVMSSPPDFESPNVSTIRNMLFSTLTTAASKVPPP